MDLHLVMEQLRPGENVSPDLSSYDNMKNLWRGSGDCPSKEECQVKWKEIESQLNATKYIEERRKEYNKRGATVEYLLEALIEKVAENKNDKLNEIQAIRQKVKQDFPKP